MHSRVNGGSNYDSLMTLRNDCKWPDRHRANRPKKAKSLPTYIHTDSNNKKARTHTHTCIYVCVCIYLRTHTYIYMYIYIYTGAYRLAARCRSAEGGRAACRMASLGDGWQRQECQSALHLGPRIAKYATLGRVRAGWRGAERLSRMAVTSATGGPTGTVQSRTKKSKVRRRVEWARPAPCRTGQKKGNEDLFVRSEQIFES